MADAAHYVPRIVAVLMFLRIREYGVRNGRLFSPVASHPAICCLRRTVSPPAYRIRRYLPELGFGSLVAAVTAMATTMTVIRLFGAGSCTF